MAIVKMKRLGLLAMREDREAILHALQGLGCVEISEPTLGPQGDEDAAPAEQLLASLSSPDTRALADAQARHHDAQRAMEVLRHDGAKGRGFLSPKPGARRDELYAPQAMAQQDKAVADVLEADRQVTALLAQQEKLAAQRASLAPWLGLDVPLCTASTPDMLVQFGTLTAGRPLEEATRAVQNASELACLTQASASRELRYCLLVCHSSVQDAVLEALRGFGWARMDLSGWNGTARESDRALCAQQAQVRAGLEQARARLAGMHGQMDALCRASDRALLDIHLQESRALLRDTRQVFLLQGWVPAGRWEEVQAALAKYPCAWEVADPPESEYPQVPVQLKNNWFTRPLNMVTEMYSLPAYGTVDPNPLMAPFFIFFYGMMMADMGYGLLMILGCAFIIKKKNLRGEKAQFFNLFKYCGFATFAFGLITGSFFGNLIPQLTEMLTGTAVNLPSLFSPLDDALAVLLGSLVLGLVQIFTGMAVNIYNKVRRGQVMDALCNEGAWYLVFILGGCAALTGKVKPFVIAIIVLLVLTQGYGKKGIGGKLMGIGGSLYNNITGYFSDILSYSRLMALMLAGAVIAQVFNTLGSITGNVVLFFLISMIGNALNMALNLLGCYVHDMRLQCLEFFGRFYEDGGKPFEPVKIDTEYVDVIS